MKTVLVVDDDVAALTILARICTRCSWDVLLANSGQTAIDIIRSARPIDALITDLNLLDGVDGLSVAHAALLTRGPMPALVVTSDPNDPRLHSQRSPIPVLGKPIQIAPIQQWLSHNASCVKPSTPAQPVDHPLLPTRGGLLT